MARWTLQIGDADELPLDRQLVTQCPDTRVSQARAGVQLTFVQPMEADEIPLYTPGIIRRDGALWFVGQFLDPATSADPAQERKSYLLADGRLWLERHQYRQIWAKGAGGSVALDKAIWFASGSLIEGTFTRLNVGQEVSNLINLLGLDSVTRLGRQAIQLGLCSIPAQPPPQMGATRHSSEVLDFLLGYAPDVADWWDYTTLKDGLPCPTYNVARFADLATITLDCAPLQKINIVPITQARPEYVKLVLHTETARSTSARGANYDSDYIGYIAGSAAAVPFDGIEATFDQQKTRDGSMLDAPTLAALADYYYFSARAPAWRGTLLYKGLDGEPHPTIRPGLKLRLIGGRAEWATMDALVQSVQHNILTGTTLITVGPAGRYTLDQLRELIRRIRVGLQCVPSDDQMHDKEKGHSNEHTGNDKHKPPDENDPDNKNCCCNDSYAGGHPGG